ncbi:Geranylgeranyl pyrophosphate synthetase [Lasiodiplodia theobromae]|uniref:Geranylgeranyl pyrophosphate synthetase n=1 Tax=Lasiodiplodia theobromae TaxID=45133 RepID=UPI0015C34FE0|nr:Geranylgeranyl pyrophosphate synthetase [Lasiodiplodia theobromae]KAF4544412.1 Geranylgeranyl pyrophosphate synthetase [Lasiodiplodia theobromae]
MPSCPFSPLFAALRVTNPSFSFAGAVDLLANRSSLRKLLGFASGHAPQTQTFRIDATLVRDNTLVLFRHDRTLREVLLPGAKKRHEAMSYGHGFEAAFTAQEEPALRRQQARVGGHYRTIAYELGALRCVVQCEVDAWYDEERGCPDDEPAAAGAQSKGEKQRDEDVAARRSGVSSTASVTSAPSAAAQNKTPRRPKGMRKSSSSAALSVLDGRVEHQPSAQQLAELKVRRKSPFRTFKTVAQMWLGRTPYLISGLHNEGVFSMIRVENVGERFSSWESLHQESLKKLVAVITELKELLIAQRQNMSGTSGGGSPASMTWGIVFDHKKKPARLSVYDLTKKSKTFSVPQEDVEAFWPEH